MAEPAQQAVGTIAAAGAPTESVWLRSERFGTHEIPAGRVIEFPDGLVGFADAHRFVLLESSRPSSPFRCLASLDVPELGFVVCEPTVLWPDYGTDLARLVDLGATTAVMALVTVPADASAMTANLMAPLLIDTETRTGRQLVIEDGRYAMRQPILRAEPAAE